MKPLPNINGEAAMLMRGKRSDMRYALAAALGWPGGISNEPPPWRDLLRMVAYAQMDRQMLMRALQEADRVMRHDDSATEWRERWGKLMGDASKPAAAEVGLLEPR